MKILKDKSKAIVRGALVLLLFHYAVIFQYIPIVLFNINVSSLKGNIYAAVLFSMFAEVWMFIILMIVYRKDLIQEVKNFFKDVRKNIDIGLTSWVIGLIIMMVVNYILITILHSDGANNEKYVRSLISASPFLMAIDICLVAPAVEEIVFRKTLKDIFSNRIAFMMAAFLLFGLAHVTSTAKTLLDWFYIIPYGALGAAFAYAYHKTDSIMTSFICHALHNLFVFLLIIVL